MINSRILISSLVILFLALSLTACGFGVRGGDKAIPGFTLTPVGGGGGGTTSTLPPGVSCGDNPSTSLTPTYTASFLELFYQTGYNAEIILARPCDYAYLSMLYNIPTGISAADPDTATLHDLVKSYVPGVDTMTYVDIRNNLAGDVNIQVTLNCTANAMTNILFPSQDLFNISLSPDAGSIAGYGSAPGSCNIQSIHITGGTPVITTCTLVAGACT